MLHDFFTLWRILLKKPSERECLSYYLYGKQHENVSFYTDYKLKTDNIDKQGKEIADKLEKSIQKALDKKK